MLSRVGKEPRTGVASRCDGSTTRADVETPICERKSRSPMPTETGSRLEKDSGPLSEERFTPTRVERNAALSCCILELTVVMSGAPGDMPSVGSALWRPPGEERSEGRDGLFRMSGLLGGGLDGGTPRGGSRTGGMGTLPPSLGRTGRTSGRSVGMTGGFVGLCGDRTVSVPEPRPGRSLAGGWLLFSPGGRIGGRISGGLLGAGLVRSSRGGLLGGTLGVSPIGGWVGFGCVVSPLGLPGIGFGLPSVGLLGGGLIFSSTGLPIGGLVLSSTGLPGDGLILSSTGLPIGGLVLSSVGLLGGGLILSSLGLEGVDAIGGFNSGLGLTGGGGVLMVVTAAVLLIAGGWIRRGALPGSGFVWASLCSS